MIKKPINNKSLMENVEETTLHNLDRETKRSIINHHWLLVILLAVFILLFVTAFLVMLLRWPMRLLTNNTTNTTVSTQPVIPIKIVAVGDISCDPNAVISNSSKQLECQDTKVVELVKTLNPEKILLLGDIQYDSGTQAAFDQAFDKKWGSLKSKILPTPGNHEYVTKNALGYYNYFNDTEKNGVAGETGQGYYHSSIGEWNIYSLNSNCPETNNCAANSPQIQWLTAELQKNQGLCQLAFWHHPQFSSGKHSIEPAQINRLPLAWQLLQANKAEFILNGHDHSYERFAPQSIDGQQSNVGIREFVVGTGGRSLYPKIANRPNSEYFNNENFGVLELELYSGSYSWKFLSVSGAIIDQGQASCF